MSNNANTILAILADHVVGLRCVFNRVLGGDCGNALQELRERHLVGIHKFVARLNLYQLSKHGCAYMGVPETRSRNLGSQSLAIHIGILWLCHMQNVQRELLTRDQLASLYEEDAPTGDHILETVDDHHRVFRVLVPSPDTQVKSILRNVRFHLEKVNQLPKVTSAITARAYGFIVAVDTEWRKTVLIKALATEQHNIYVKIAIAPSQRTLLEAIHEHQVQTRKV